MGAEPSVEELLRRFVAIDTVSSKSPEPLAAAVCEVLDRPGVRCRLLPGPDDGKASLVVQVGPSTDPATREGLVLCGHMDVVPAAEPEWESDPFTLTREGDRWVGRGSADMKGFLALAVGAAAGLDPTRLRHPLVLLFTYDEEVGTRGARHFSERWAEEEVLPRRVLVGEPTELLVVPRHKGHLEARVVVHGESAHSAYPHLGRNAIAPMAELVRALGALGEELREMRLPSSEHFPEVPFPSINIGTIQGGTAVNIVPDRCVLEVGVRLLPGLDEQLVIEQLRSTAATALAGSTWSFEVVALSPPMESPSDADLLLALAELGCGLGASVSYATDAGWLQRVGLECVIWGPGSIRVAHKPNEWIAAADLQEAETVLAGVVRRFCASDEVEG